MNCFNIRTWRQGVRCLALAVAAQLFITAAAPAQTKVTWVRGKVEWKGTPNYPAAKIAVSFVPRAFKGNKSRTKLVYTGSNGMYDFHVTPGTYILTVTWSEKNSKSFLIEVRGDRPNLDIAPIVIP
jgi:hypothetical protein